ncbi:hypothetical protein C6P46_001341 [Rhodotorula mucilaginosa]|uniref:Uncharacterized protein n=1 Tax=Rhodotorula mucilaginosa TaxID=5537 RepID=A0A9P7B1W3_RHOMI|nr:hypothetical protein C6P46_001341 [Rhodotorula mucilaginosa]
MGRSGVLVGGAPPAHKARNAKHAAASAPKPAPPPHRHHHRVKAALHAPRGRKRGDVEVLDLVSDATSDSEDSDSDSDVEILDAAPFVENEVLVLSDDDDDDDDDDYDFRARADEVVLSSDEEEDDSDDQVVIVSDNLAQGKTAGKAAAATPARFRKARDPAADLKWFMPERFGGEAQRPTFCVKLGSATPASNTSFLLATLAFSYKIQYHAPFDSLHTFADAMEAFIESLFSSDIWHNNLAALEWLVALWSPTCFPLLQADLAAYDPPPEWDGEANLDRRYSKWMKKRAKWS